MLAGHDKSRDKSGTKARVYIWEEQVRELGNRTQGIRDRMQIRKIQVAVSKGARRKAQINAFSTREQRVEGHILVTVHRRIPPSTNDNQERHRYPCTPPLLYTSLRIKLNQLPPISCLFPPPHPSGFLCLRSTTSYQADRTRHNRAHLGFHLSLHPYSFFP